MEKIDCPDCEGTGNGCTHCEGDCYDGVNKICGYASEDRLSPCERCDSTGEIDEE